MPIEHSTSVVTYKSKLSEVTSQVVVSAKLFSLFFLSCHFTFMSTLKFLLHLRSHWKNIMHARVSPTILASAFLDIRTTYALLVWPFYRNPW